MAITAKSGKKLESKQADPKGTNSASKKVKTDEHKKAPQLRAEVRQAFLKKKSKRGGNLYSDGTSLWSYGWWEIARWVRGQVILRKGRAYSRTTEIRHRRGLPGTPAKTETPMQQPTMNL